MTGYGLAFPHNSKHRDKFNSLLLEYRFSVQYSLQYAHQYWAGQGEWGAGAAGSLLAPRGLQAQHAGEEGQRATLHRPGHKLQVNSLLNLLKDDTFFARDVLGGFNRNS